MLSAGCPAMSVETVRKVSVSEKCPDSSTTDSPPFRGTLSVVRVPDVAASDRRKESNRRQYVKNRDKRLADAKAYAEANREARVERDRARRSGPEREAILAAERERYQRRREGLLADQRRRRAEGHYRIREHGLTPTEYDAMLDRQGGVCAICRRPMDRICIDHDHRTGRVRGLLCHNCNVALGHFRDSPGLLYASIAYLQGIR